MKARATFDTIVSRAESMLSLYAVLHEMLGAPPAELEELLTVTDATKTVALERLTDLVRTSLVLAVSAFDAYYTDKFVEVCVPALRRREPTKRLAELLERAGLNATVALELIKMERPFRRIRKLLDAHLDRQVTQRLDKIDELFFVLGVKDLCANAAAKAHRTRLCRSVELAVERRHEIVHAGDLNDRGRLRPISVPTVGRWIKEMSLLVKNCDEIIDSAVH